MARWAPVTALLRILGVELMARLGRRLPSPLARTLSAAILVGANLLPLWAVLEGRLGMGEVLLVYWFETVVVWFTTTVRLLTSTRRRDPSSGGRQPGPAGRPRFPRGPRLAGLERWLAAKTWVSGDPADAVTFALRFGVLTVVHGVVAVVLAVLAGLRGGPLDWVATSGVILLSHLLSVGLNWFGRRERAFADPVRVGLLLLGGPDGPTARDAGAVALLVGCKTGLDLVLHLLEHVALARRSGVAAGARVTPPAKEHASTR
jgi:hypothetical protein